MKKVLIFILALALICTNAFAAGISQNGTSVTVTDVPEGGKLIIAGYDEAGRLSASKIYAPENGTINAENSISGAAKTKMFLWDIDTLAPIEMTEQQPSAGGKMLVAYFSWTNNTEGIANHIADITGADKFEIIPVEPYGEENNNYYDQSTRAYKEQYDDSARPEISGTVQNMEQYDVVFLGFPIWYGKAPKLIYTFLESYDFEGKMVVPFCTSGSSGISTRELVPLAPEANWLDGRRFSGGASRSTVEEWVNSLDIEIEEEPEVTDNKMTITVGGAAFIATLEDSPAAAEFKKLLPMTLRMSELNGNEKYYYLDADLPSAASNPGTIHEGDIMLYGSNCVVIFYKTFNTSYSYTKIGHIDDTAGLSAAVGRDDVSVEFK